MQAVRHYALDQFRIYATMLFVRTLLAFSAWLLLLSLPQQVITDASIRIESEGTRWLRLSGTLNVEGSATVSASGTGQNISPNESHSP